MVQAIPKRLLVFGRKLRKKPTVWESKLWEHLRNRNLGARFKRQVRIGNYIADFCCNESKLIIELDGSYHNKPYYKKVDYERYKFLKQEGYKILRFWNIEIDRNLDSVLEKIIREVD